MHFALDLVEEIDGEWVVLQGGAVELALHRAGTPFPAANRSAGATSNAKIVFSIPEDIGAMRERMIAAGVVMRGVKRYDGFPYLLCDGQDPEGNVFQLMQPDEVRQIT